MISILLLATSACSHHDTGREKPDDTDTGVAPDSHPTETDTGDTSDSGDTDTAPPAPLCDRSLGWKYVACGYEQTCGIHTDGCAECWGRGEEESSPKSDTGWLYYWNGEDRPPAGEYLSISMIGVLLSDPDPSTPNACGILSDGSALCWGDGEYGVNDVPAGSFTDLAVSYAIAYGIEADGTLLEWGFFDEALNGSFMQAESGFTDLFLTTSGELVVTNGVPGNEGEAPPGTFIDIGIGEGDACAVQTNGEILCWGQLDPLEAESYHMTTTAPTGTFVDVCVAAQYHACALDEAGLVTCWDGTDSKWTAPTDETFTQLACGGWHACGVTPDNRIVCWGYDFHGETIPPT